MLEFIAGVFNGLVQFFSSLLDPIFKLVTFNPIAPLLEQLTTAWATVGSAWRALCSYVPFGIVADAAGSLLPLFVVIWLIFIVWRLIRVNS